MLVSNIMIALAQSNRWSKLLICIGAKPELLQCEQSCSESPSLTCHGRSWGTSLVAALTIIRRRRMGSQFGKAGTLAMDPVVHKRHIVLAFIIDSLRKIFGMDSGDFASQRMCPFCGLITSRRKTCCLECGKSLKPA